jgi:hypothetical protein
MSLSPYLDSGFQRYPDVIGGSDDFYGTDRLAGDYSDSDPADSEHGKCAIHNAVLVIEDLMRVC